MSEFLEELYTDIDSMEVICIYVYTMSYQQTDKPTTTHTFTTKQTF